MYGRQALIWSCMTSALIEDLLLLTTAVDYITSVLFRANYKIAEIQSETSNE